MLLLLGGVAFGFSYTTNRQWRVIKNIEKEWQKINRKELPSEIKNLYKSKLVEKRQNPNGSLTLVLTNKGKLEALTYYFNEMKIEKTNWDGKWRFVVFDVPEKFRRGRDSLREKIKRLGFYELQKSVFVFPYECRNEIEFIVEFFGIRKYVRYGTMDYIDNDSRLREVFGLK